MDTAVATTDGPGPVTEDLPGFVAAGRAAGERLLVTARELGTDESIDPTEGLQRYLSASAHTQIYVAAAPQILEQLGAEAGPIADPDSPAAGEIRSLFSIAADIAGDPQAKELIIDRSSAGAAKGLAAEFPRIHRLVVDHIEEFGWVRTAITDLAPLTTREMMQRIQSALLRWDPEDLAAAAKADPAPGDEPETVTAFRTVAEEIAFSPGLEAKARWLARPFFARVAAALERTPERLRKVPPDAILAVLAGEAPLPDVEAGGESDLVGQSVSLGRAVGRVRVILDADDGARLKVGDILVTNLSTPTYEGEPSLFPYRTVPSVRIDRAGGIVIDEGGLLSHAAIVCRENQVPCILGAEEATARLRDGMIVEVDATRGNGRITILQN